MLSSSALLASVAALLIGGMMTEIKRSPWTTISALLALILGVFSITTRAPASDVDEIKAQLNSINITQLERYLIETRAEMCKATEKRFYTQRLKELQTEYIAKTGQRYDVPSCDEVAS